MSRVCKFVFLALSSSLYERREMSKAEGEKGTNSRGWAHTFDNFCVFRTREKERENRSRRASFSLHEKSPCSSSPLRCRKFTSLEIEVNWVGNKPIRMLDKCPSKMIDVVFLLIILIFFDLFLPFFPNSSSFNSETILFFVLPTPRNSLLNLFRQFSIQILLAI